MKYIKFRKLTDLGRRSIPAVVHKYIPGFELFKCRNENIRCTFPKSGQNY